MEGETNISRNQHKIMISFTLSIIALIIGYFLYGRSGKKREIRLGNEFCYLFLGNEFP